VECCDESTVCVGDPGGPAVATLPWDSKSPISWDMDDMDIIIDILDIIYIYI
jgi:hypothetical protein